MKKIVEILTKENKTISTMESCTGGLVASCITDIEGASEVLKFSAVTYSNEYKIKMGVDSKIIDKYSVYSIETAQSMAKSISQFSSSNYGIGITGKLNRVDPNNLFNDDSTIYISIYDKDEEKYYNKVLKAVKDTRLENKKYIVREIEELLISLFRETCSNSMI